MAKKAANEPVSSDEEEYGVDTGVQGAQQPQSSARRVGMTKASFRNNSSSNMLSQAPNSTNSQSDDPTSRSNGATIGISVEISSPSRKERRGSIQFRKLRKLAKSAAKEPLSDDEDSIDAGDGGVAAEKVDGDSKQRKNCDNDKNHGTSSVQPRTSILRSKSKTLENIPSLQQRKETLFDK